MINTPLKFTITEKTKAEKRQPAIVRHNIKTNKFIIISHLNLLKNKILLKK